MSTSTAVADFTNTANWQGVDDEPVAGSNNLVKSGGVADADVELFEKINNKTLDIDKEYSLDIDVPAIGNYTLIPIQLKAGRYEVTATAIGEGSPFLYINNASKQRLGNLLSSRIFDLAQENECLFISTDDRNTATRVTIKITYSDEAFVPFQYGSKRKYLLNVSTNKWTVSNNTYHLQIPVHEGDIIRTKGKNSDILYGFLASEILHPVAGADVPVLDSGTWPLTIDTVTTVPVGATILIVNARSVENVDLLPLYLSINGFDMINDTIGGILQSGNGSRFIGVVTPETVISTPKQNAFAIGVKGTYTQFGGSVIVPEGYVGVFTYDTSWSAAIVDVLGYAVPSVWAASVNNCISHVQANNLLSGKNGDSFVFVTDSHFSNNKGNGVILAAAVSKKTNNKMFVHGGDFVTKNKTKEQFFTILRNYAEQLKVLYGENWRVLFGNHDNNTQDGNGDQSQLTTKDDFYALMYKGFESEIINPNRNMYYYWDNVNQNIRYVCFDFGVSGIGKEQVTWFASVAQSAPGNARIVIINHGMWNAGSDETFYGYNVDLANMCNAINTRSTYTFDGTIYNFSDITVKVSVVLCGHIHGYKYTYYGANPENMPEYIGLPVIAFEADQYNGAETSPVTLFTQKVHFIDLDFTQAKIHIFTLGYNINDSQGRDDKTPLDIVV